MESCSALWQIVIERMHFYIAELIGSQEGNSLQEDKLHLQSS